MAFRKIWRAYQSLLLDDLDRFLDYKRLYLVAAQGLGKTVLGLEVVRRINHPTRVLAPTITIRDQWVDRLVERFLAPGSGSPTWVSTDLEDLDEMIAAQERFLDVVGFESGSVQ